MLLLRLSLSWEPDPVGQNAVKLPSKTLSTSGVPVHSYRIIMTPLSTTLGISRCVSIDGEGPESVRLKRMGICSGRDIEVVQAGDPMIVHVAGARVGLSRKLASRIQVDSAEPQLLKAASGG